MNSYVGTGVRKSDAHALTTGQPVYTEIAPACLIVKVLRSPHAHALIPISTPTLPKVPGIACPHL